VADAVLCTTVNVMPRSLLKLFKHKSNSFKRWKNINIRFFFWIKRDKLGFQVRPSASEVRRTLFFSKEKNGRKKAVELPACSPTPRCVSVTLDGLVVLRLGPNKHRGDYYPSSLRGLSNL
jgi:hypothetical protein